MADEVQVDGRLVDPTRCAFLQSTIANASVIHRCPANGTVEVLVPVKAAGGMFFGAGVRALACREHAAELVERYDGKLP